MNWSHHGILGTQAPFVNIHDIHLSVHDVITNDGNHTQSLYIILPSNLVDVINIVRLNFNPSIENDIIWPQNKNGIYSTNSGYNWLISHHASDHHHSISWSWIWRLKVPEKLKFLVWLAWHEAIPSLALLNHRNMVNSLTCSRCGDQDESLFHCLRDCNYSMDIWKKIGFFCSFAFCLFSSFC